jgi:hypothetical protein
MGRCKDCPRHLVATVKWRALTATVRQQLRDTGHRRHAARGLCDSCYRKRIGRGTLIDVERNTVPRDMVRDEWERSYNPEVSINENVRRLAPRMGMSFDALDMAVRRMRQADRKAAA